jgi:glycosyltransferase involved in cell wall biosynthesis
MPDHHVVLSFGDVFRQSGYRTKVLGQLAEYESRGGLNAVLIAFDRDAAQLSTLQLDGVSILAHGRRGILHYYPDLWRLSRRGAIRIVHAHNLYSGALALTARWLFGYKVLVELHGRIPEEYVVLGKGGQASFWLLKKLESWVMRSADHILPISEKLKSYLVQQYSLPPSRLTVIPDSADPKAFRWDLTVRAAARKRLGLESKFVCVHLGSVFIWYDPDLIAKVFQKIRERQPSAHLLVVTEDVERTRNYLSPRLPADQFTVRGVPHNEVPELLAASDIGFLLLKSTVNIEVASPSKFSEYLNSGLPVLITPRVGDFSALIASTGAGAIVSDEGVFDVRVVDEIAESREKFAQRAVEAGRTLTWDAFRATWNSIIEGLKKG